MKRLDVENVSPACDVIRGHGSRELIQQVTGRAPMWSPLSRGWGCQPHTTAEVVARAERLGYLVTTSNPPTQRPCPVVAEPIPNTAPADPMVGLW